MDIYAEVTEWKKKLDNNFYEIDIKGKINDNTHNRIFCMIMEEKQTIVTLGAGSITKRVYGKERGWII